MPGGSFLEKIPAPARTTDFAHNLIIRGSRHDDYFGSERFRPDSADQLDAVQFGEIEIDNRDIGPLAPDLLERRIAVRCSCHHLETFASGEYRPETVAAQSVFV